MQHDKPIYARPPSRSRGRYETQGLPLGRPGQFAPLSHPALTRAIQVAPGSVASVRGAGISRAAATSRVDFIRERYAFKREAMIRLFKAFLRNLWPGY